MIPVLLQRISREDVGDGALFLIVGGLFMLGLVVALVVLRSIFPSGQPARGLRRDRLTRKTVETPSLQQVPPKAEIALEVARLDEGRREGTRFPATNLDDALEHILTKGWGDPRLLRHHDDRTVVRLHTCAECAETQSAGCAFQAGFIEGVMIRLEGAQARVRETACKAAGHPVCEFEVQH